MTLTVSGAVLAVVVILAIGLALGVGMTVAWYSRRLERCSDWIIGKGACCKRKES